MEKTQQITRADFIEFFRDEERLNELTVADRVEIFRTVLTANLDVSKDLLNEILKNHTVCNLDVVEL